MVLSWPCSTHSEFVSLKVGVNPLASGRGGFQAVLLANALWAALRTKLPQAQSSQELLLNKQLSELPHMPKLYQSVVAAQSLEHSEMYSFAQSCSPCTWTATSALAMNVSYSRGRPKGLAQQNPITTTKSLQAMLHLNKIITCILPTLSQDSILAHQVWQPSALSKISSSLHTTLNYSQDDDQRTKE